MTRLGAPSRESWSQDGNSGTRGLLYISVDLDLGHSPEPHHPPPSCPPGRAWKPGPGTHSIPYMEAGRLRGRAVKEVTRAAQARASDPTAVLTLTQHLSAFRSAFSRQSPLLFNSVHLCRVGEIKLILPRNASFHV